MVDVVVENNEEGEGQRGTTTKEEDHVILLWYTSSSVPGSDVPLTRHTLQLASLQDPEEWVCLSYGSDRASLALYITRAYTRNACFDTKFVRDLSRIRLSLSPFLFLSMTRSDNSRQ